MPQRLSAIAGGDADRIIGVDLGGTKCAVSRLRHGVVEEIIRLPTGEFAPTITALSTAIGHCAPANPLFGLSCGGPLDATRGVILSPPNLLPSWHGTEICRQLTDTFGGQAFLMNDANACALAEWQFGAGRGCQHLVFLTSGTGMGAGIILNGQNINHKGITPDKIVKEPADATADNDPQLQAAEAYLATR